MHRSRVSRQTQLFPIHKAAEDRRLSAAPPHAPRCEVILNHRGGETTRCLHGARPYLVNGLFRVQWCKCCLTRIKRKHPAMKIAPSQN